MGWAFIITCSLNILFNISLVVLDTIYGMKDSYDNYKEEQELKKTVKKVDEAKWELEHAHQVLKALGEDPEKISKVFGKDKDDLIKKHELSIVKNRLRHWSLERQWCI